MSRNQITELTKERDGKVTRLKNSENTRVAHFINPVSGSHRFYDATRKAVDEIGGKIFVSERSGQITEMVIDALEKDPSTHVVVYGGDGSIYEAVNGIMQSGHNDTAVLSVIPSGSGNDFSAYANDSGVFSRGEIHKIDLIKTTCGGETRYFDNMMNMGFDCSVVYETSNVRKAGVIKGSAAYIAGVVKVLGQKKTMNVSLTLSDCVSLSTGKPVDDFHVEKSLLLTACANAAYCGGGFKAAPISKIDDGYMDVLVINDVTRPKFISLVGDYRAGTFINEKGVMKKSFREYVDYIRCKKMTIVGPEMFCLDGELFETNGEEIVAEVAHNAINFMAI